ncbi:hypothetical protein H696_04013 [Fonticula alba]|uniref:Uncharacterized protein n=1 Tax=Fonticula alba TaxID=691883 RepID=A0A058Z6P5_FONAL|nr:hypothetical protein H696_04013 [Fonticula alba]KCV69593.1 hypothetical protein H696_04013 [Fonticula alba]|eukprot:XP_009496158.1 hypothetical protein H696_04013 [Fonticula alba]
MSTRRRCDRFTPETTMMVPAPRSPLLASPPGPPRQAIERGDRPGLGQGGGRHFRCVCQPSRGKNPHVWLGRPGRGVKIALASWPGAATPPGPLPGVAARERLPGRGAPGG